MKAFASCLVLAFTSATMIGCVESPFHSQSNAESDKSFSIAVIPDTQNYVDYKHQKAEGFALDSSELFIEQMQYIADRSVMRGGDIVFLTAVGDIWQHQSIEIDEAHTARGFEPIHNPFFAIEIEWTDKTRDIEIPKAIEGYRIISQTGMPFGVAPGNHDYDAMWSVKEYPPNINKRPDQLTMTVEDLGLLHIGGLDNFRSAFGDNSDFFRDKPWYVDSYAGGANAAQRFTAGGYTFLNITLQMQAPDDVLAWVETVLKANPGLPTIITTHDYLDPQGQRAAAPIVNLKLADPDFHNSAEELWQKLIRDNDQIFMVLCGHHHGQALRVDNNNAGHQVYQILADYQDRGRAGIDAGQPLSRYTGKPVGIGDGWFRLLNFSFPGGAEQGEPANPTIEVVTYSTYFDKRSSDVASYAQWYRDHEQPQMSDAEFYAADAYTLELTDFVKRFGSGSNSDASQ